MEMKSKRLKSIHLNSDRLIEDSIYSKPYLGLFSFFAFGLVFIFFTQYWILGLLISVFCIFGLIKVKNHCVTEFNDQYVLFYNEGNWEECNLIYWDEIHLWSYETGKVGLDIVKIELSDGHQMAFHSYSRKKIMKYFNQHVACKNIEYKRDEDELVDLDE